MILKQNNISKYTAIYCLYILFSYSLKLNGQNILSKEIYEYEYSCLKKKPKDSVLIYKAVYNENGLINKEILYEKGIKSSEIRYFSNNGSDINRQVVLDNKGDTLEIIKSYISDGKEVFLGHRDFFSKGNYRTENVFTKNKELVAKILYRKKGSKRKTHIEKYYY